MHHFAVALRLRMPGAHEHDRNQPADRSAVLCPFRSRYSGQLRQAAEEDGWRVARLASKLLYPVPTGMVGSYALRYALDHPAVCRVTAIGRRSHGISHPKLKEVLHKDFADCSGVAEALSDQ